MMRKVLKRRTFMQGFAVTNCMLAVGWPSQGSAANTSISVQKVNERISVITGAGGNAVLYQGDNALTLIDSGSSEHAQSLLNLIDEIASNIPITTLFNTHWHEDHTGGNELIRARGAEIVAHENTKLWLDADFYVEWQQWGHKPRPFEALPTISFYNGGEMDLGEETVQYQHYQQAHTDGDISLYFPKSNVIVAGGLLSHRYPITDIATGGWIGGLIKANAAMLEAIDNDTIIIPGQGPIMKKTDLQAQHDMLIDIFEQMKALVQQGYSGHDMLTENMTTKYDTNWGAAEEFIIETYRGMWAHTSDIGGFF